MILRQSHHGIGQTPQCGFRSATAVRCGRPHVLEQGIANIRFEIALQE
jgi:hypothetical protein